VSLGLVVTGTVSELWISPTARPAVSMWVICGDYVCETNLPSVPIILIPLSFRYGGFEFDDPKNKKREESDL
jgi:hypothetical protein